MAANWAWSIAKRFMWTLRAPAIRTFISREYTDYLCSCVAPRPHGYSLCGPPGDISDYVSWPSLTDRKFSARHLAPGIQASLPTPGRPGHVGQTWEPTTELWRRQAGKLIECERSNVLFAFFAQWFTDSILRVDGDDRRRNTSNHDIDLCSVYGLDDKTTRLLRSRDPNERGQLAHRGEDGEEYPDLLYEMVNERAEIKPRYRELPYINKLETLNAGFPAARLQTFYATGLERGNSSLGYVAINTLFLREHNRLCRELVCRHDDWDDERVFQTARSINTAILLKLLVEEYINHILGEQLFLLEPRFADRRFWYRPNWMSIEFNLLYRWHGLVPDSLSIDGRNVEPPEFRHNNALFEKVGLTGALQALAAQPAGKIGLANTPDFLLAAEFESVRMSREYRLRSFNDYCQLFGVPLVGSFEDLTGDEVLAKRISDLYDGDINRLELLVGLFAQAPDEGVLFGPLMARMVAYDALTQIYSNPLLSEHVYGREVLTSYGCEQVETTTLDGFVRRNAPGWGDERASFIAPGKG